MAGHSLYKDQFRQALKLKRRSMAPAARRKPLPRQQWKYPWAVEAAYAKQIATWLKPLIVYTEAYLKEQAGPLLRGDTGHQDATPGDAFALLINTLNGWAGVHIPSRENKEAGKPPIVEIGLGQFAEKTKGANGKQWATSTESVLGVSFDTDEAWWDPMKDQWGNTNYDLIKNLSGNYIKQINDLTEKAIVNGWTSGQLMKDIMALGTNMSVARARLIARDQVGKLNGAITQARMEEVGLSMYIWSTSADERVRSSHRPLDDKLCQWDDSSVYSMDKGKTWIPRPMSWSHSHPGYDVQCRCTALSYYDELVDELDQEIVPSVAAQPVVPVPEEITGEVVRSRLKKAQQIDVGPLMESETKAAQAYLAARQPIEHLHASDWTRILANPSHPLYGTLKEVNRMKEGVAAAQTNIAEAHSKNATVLRRVLSLPNKDRATLPVIQKATTGKLTPAQADADAFIRSIVKKDRVPAVTITPKTSKRAFYLPNARTVTLPPKANIYVTLHETMHDMEFHNPAVAAKSKAFLLKRAGNRAPVSLNSLTNTKAYTANEMAYEDEFQKKGGSHYMGKIYADNATELISMGAERLYRSPLRFAQDDPEYFDFMISILQGGL